MTEFRKHDRVRALESGPSTVDGATALVEGRVYTVHTVGPGGRIDIADDDSMWAPRLFELLEHAVAEDKDGKPLYAGDVVSVVAGDAGGAIYCDVTADQSDSVSVRVQNRGAVYTPPCREVTLTRHRWEPEAAPESLEFSAEDGFEMAGHSVKAGDTVTLTISDPEMVPFEVHGGVYDGPEGLMAGAWPIIGHPHVTLTDHQPAEPEWKPGTTGTATVEDASGIDGTWIRSHSGRLYFATHEGGTSTGNLADVDNVTDFVPDDAEALRVQLADAERALAEILPVINELDDGSVYDGSYAQILSDGIGRLRREVARARQLATDRLGGMHANGEVTRKTAEALGIDAALARRHGDAFMAEVERLRNAEIIAAGLATCPHGQTAEELCNKLPDDRTLTGMQRVWSAMSPEQQRAWEEGKPSPQAAPIALDETIDLALKAIHDQPAGRRYRVSEVKEIIYPLVNALRNLRAKILPTELTKCICPWDSEDRGGGHSEIVGEYEPACPVHSTHVYDPRQGMWVERAARTLPTQEVAQPVWEPESSVDPSRLTPPVATPIVSKQAIRGAIAKGTGLTLGDYLQLDDTRPISPRRATARVAELLREHGIEVRDS